MSKDAPVVMLVDNGSTRAAATLGLRTIAASLSTCSGMVVHPVSLQHADAIPAQQLDGRPAAVFAGFLRERLAAGECRFLVLPLFFGPSRALTKAIPAEVERLSAEHGDLDVQLADPLVPLPAGEPRLADILADHARQSVDERRRDDYVVVVDHGSPLPAVNAVRRYAVDQLRRRLPAQLQLEQAVMERREDTAYDFNGELLADLLDRLAAGERQAVSVSVAMMFLLPGRHAGPGGDVVSICREAMARNRGLEVAVSPLIGEHPVLVEILQDRLQAALGH